MIDDIDDSDRSSSLCQNIKPPKTNTNLLLSPKGTKTFGKIQDLQIDLRDNEIREEEARPIKTEIQPQEIIKILGQLPFYTILSPAM